MPVERLCADWQRDCLMKICRTFSEKITEVTATVLEAPRCEQPRQKNFLNVGLF